MSLTTPMTKHYETRHIASVCFALSMCAAPWAQAQQFTNGSFEEPRVGKFTNIANGAHIPGWDITEGNVSINRTTWAAADGDQTLELNGTTAGSISQSVSGFVVGNNYKLSLNYALHPSGEYARAYVSINGENVLNVAAASGRKIPNYKVAQVEFTATASTMDFGIVNQTEGGAGLVLDNISLAKSYDDVESQEEAARFLISSTFGPTWDSIKDLRTRGYSNWFKNEVNISPTYTLPTTVQLFTDRGYDFGQGVHTFERMSKSGWFTSAVLGKDEVRQRAAFALSQIFVASSNTIPYKIHLQAKYQDIFIEHAFGNFRDILNDVTYSPMMGLYLTYLRNQKGNPVTGTQPDENFAREIMQLFTIGLVELNQLGQPKLDSQGNEIPTYSNDDITELAKVFTGLNWADRAWGDRQLWHPQEFDLKPMEMFNDYHSEGTKTFLGETVPDYGDGDKTIDHALDILFNHPNVGPFIGKQLIQRFTTSNPGPSYVFRVTKAFNSGVYTLPDGSTVGTGERGDMQALWAAVLFGSQTFGYPNQLENWGKIREPLVRLVHWARVARVSGLALEWNHDRGLNSIGGQTAFRAPSVFNFYRPEFVALNSATAEAGYVSPELQIYDGINLIDYQNKMRIYNFRIPTDSTIDPSGFQKHSELVPSFPFSYVFLDRQGIAPYVNYLNLVLTGNRMSDETVARINEAVESIDVTDLDHETGLRRRAAVAMFMATTSVEYITQQTL